MIETIATADLPIREVMRIKKNSLCPEQLTGEEQRLCIITGVHGDDLAGQFICYGVIKRIKENYEALTGIVDVYPAINPLGLDAGTREWPLFNMDMNMAFPGSFEGTMTEYTAAKIMEDLKGANVCVDIHTSSIFLKELPQVRINDDVASSLMPYAKQMNMDFVWIHPSTTVKEGSIVHALNERGTKAMVIEGDVAMQIDQKYCNQVVDGIFALMKYMGIWQGEVKAPKKPIISDDGKVIFINGETSGVFVPMAEHSDYIKKGEKIGEIIAPLTGSVEEEIFAPCDGLLFTLRHYPVVSEGALLARILGGNL